MSPELKRYVAEMIKVPGVYLAQDSEVPGHYVVITSIGGKLYALAPTHELAPDRFKPTAILSSLAVFVPD
jgi:hypothetical protein